MCTSGPHPPSFLLLLVGSNFLKMNQAVCDRPVMEGRSGKGGWGLTVYPSIWERFPLAGKKQFPAPLVLASPPLTSFQLEACQLRWDILVSGRRQWTRDLARAKLSVTPNFLGLSGRHPLESVLSCPTPVVLDPRACAYKHTRSITDLQYTLYLALIKVIGRSCLLTPEGI